MYFTNRWIASRPLRPVTIVNCGELGKLKRSEPFSSNKESTEELKQAHGEKEEKRRRRRRRSSSSVSSSASEDGKRDDSSDERRRKRSSRRGTSRRERGGGGSSPSLSPTSRRNSFRRSSPHRRHKEKQPSPKSSVKRRGRGSFRYVSEAEMESGMDALPRFAASSSVNNTK